jgi:hypothetical protein
LYPKLLAVYVGACVLLKWMQYAEWYDTCRILKCSLPFYFSYVDGIMRGVVSGLAATGAIIVIFGRYIDIRSPKPPRAAAFVLTTYVPIVGITMLTEPGAFDPGLAVDLLLVGLVAASSPFLYGESLKIASQRRLPDKDKQLKMIELQYNETTNLMSMVTLLLITALAGLVYNHFALFWGYLSTTYGTANQFVWRTLTGSVIWFCLFAAGLGWFTMAPLFQRLDILKRKL